MLSFNELYGSSALSPLTMSILLSKTHEISVNSCIAQVYCLHTYAASEYCILALMGYDRYLAICYPLHYQTIMFPAKVNKLILLVIMVFFSYVQIFRVCKKLSKKNQVSAFKKCAPHLASFLNFSIGSLFDIAQHRFKMSHIAMEVRILLSICFAVAPPFANPILYGLGTYLIRDKVVQKMNDEKAFSVPF
ncbi:olfactory receptor 52A5-like [Stigmatopora argus]